VQPLLLPQFRIVQMDEPHLFPHFCLFLLYSQLAEGVGVVEFFVLGNQLEILHLVVEHLLASPKEDFHLHLVEGTFVSFFF